MTLGVAFLGTAHAHLPDHLDAVARDPAARLAAVHGTPPWHTPVPGARIAASAADALCGADAAVLLSPTARHERDLALVVAAKVPFLSEKPLAPTAARTRCLVALAASGTAPWTTAMFLRHAPALHRLKALFTDGAFGRLASVNLEFTHPGLLDGAFCGPAAWMTRPEEGATGGFADLALHLVDLLLWLDPDREPAARAARLLHHPACPVDVGGSALLTWGGIPVTVRTSWTARPGTLRVSVEGSRATATVDRGTLTVTGEGTLLEHHPPPAARDALTAFLARLRGAPGGGQPPTADEIITSARILDELARRAAT